MSYYCKKCDKIVDASEVKVLPSLHPDKPGSPWHIWTKTVNFYQNEPSSKKVAYDPVEEKTFCGQLQEVEELTEEDLDEIF